MKAVHCRPICRAVNPSVSLKTKIDESFIPVYDVEVKIVLFCGFTSLNKSSFPKSNVGSSKEAFNDSIAVLRLSLASV